MHSRTSHLLATATTTLALTLAGATASFADSASDEQTMNYLQTWLQDKGYPDVQCRIMTETGYDYDFAVIRLSAVQYLVQPHVRGTDHPFDYPEDTSAAVCSVSHPTADGPESYYVDRLEAGYALGGFDIEGRGGGARPQDCWTIAGAGGEIFTADRDYEYVLVYDAIGQPVSESPLAAGELLPLMDGGEIAEVVACTLGANPAQPTDDAGAPIGPVVQTDHPAESGTSTLARGALAAGLLTALVGLGLRRRARV